VAISNELAQKRSVLSAKLAHDFAARFAKQIQDNYSQTFATSSAADKKEVIEKINNLSTDTDKLFQIEQITETDLAALINYQRTVDLTALLLEQMQRVAPVDDTLAAFFRHNDLLGKAMLFFLHEQFRTNERFEKTLAALQREAILFFTQEISVNLKRVMEKLGLESQVKARDEFTRHDAESRATIQQSVAYLELLPNNIPKYSHLSVTVGSALSSMGEVKPAKHLFLQAIDTAPNDEEKAQAYFNLFQVRLRHQAHQKALAALQKAIDLDANRYALHDVKTYPIERLLGAGGMGCVFLCQNKNLLLETKDKRVVVKCFWESRKGEPEDIFEEAKSTHPFIGSRIEAMYLYKSSPEYARIFSSGDNHRIKLRLPNL
jgi:tetratricopeptide (TPR) repeat protein